MAPVTGCHMLTRESVFTLSFLGHLDRLSWGLHKSSDKCAHLSCLVAKKTGAQGNKVGLSLMVGKLWGWN